MPLTAPAKLNELLKKALTRAYPEQAIAACSFEHPANPEHGDFSCNIAMLLSKALKQAPRQIAENLLKKLPKQNALYDKVEVAGPGFLNFYLSQKFLNSELKKVLKQGKRYGHSKLGQKKMVVLEYSSPNSNKPQHIGHLRNNLLGLSLSRILPAAGYKVKTACIVNDRGIAICKTMVAYQKFFKGLTPEQTGVKSDHFVGDLYVRFEQEATQHPELKDEAQALLVKWEAGDAKTMALWKKIQKWVLQGYKTTYQRLGIKFDSVEYESKIYLKGKDVVLAGLEKGVFVRKEDGSVWVDLRQEGLDEKLLMRRDGTAVYMTQDLYLSVQREQKFHPDHLVFVVASEQIYHFNVLFLVFKKLGYHFAEHCHHLAYGMVNLPDGRMKSREGNVIDLDNLMDQMHGLAYAEVQKRYQNYTEQEMHEMAEKVAQAALRYGILKVDALQDIAFDLERALAFEGNTGPYLQYAHARICQILAKVAAPETADLNLLQTMEETLLLRKLYLFQEVIEDAAKQYKPSLIANYLYELATAFNSFYHAQPVLKAEANLQAARLQLIAATAQVLRNGLELLSIEAPSRM